MPRSSRCVLPRRLALYKRKLRRSLRMALPQRFDPPILLLPFGHGRPPIAEQRRRLLGRSFRGRYLHDRAHIRRQRIGNRILGRRHREAEAAQVVVLIVVAVPAAVVLHELEREPHAAGRFERLVEREHRLARHVAAAGADVDAPGRQIVAVVREFDRPRHAPLAAAVVEHLIQLALGRIHVRRRLAEFQFDPLVRMIERRRLDLEFRQRTRAVDRSARPAMRQVRIVQQLQPNRRDLRRLHFARELGRDASSAHSRPPGSNRRPARNASGRRESIVLRPHDRPLRLIACRTLCSHAAIRSGQSGFAARKPIFDLANQLLGRLPFVLLLAACRRVICASWQLLRNANIR